jgi:hypothetical protein
LPSKTYKGKEVSLVPVPLLIGSAVRLYVVPGEIINEKLFRFPVGIRRTAVDDSRIVYKVHGVDIASCLPDGAKVFYKPGGILINRNKTVVTVYRIGKFIHEIGKYVTLNLKVSLIPGYPPEDGLQPGKDLLGINKIPEFLPRRGIGIFGRNPFVVFGIVKNDRVNRGIGGNGSFRQIPHIGDDILVHKILTIQKLLGIVVQIHLKTDVGDHIAHIAVTVVYLGEHYGIGKSYAAAYVLPGNPVGNNGEGNKQNTDKDKHEENYLLVIEASGPQAFEGKPHTVSLSGYCKFNRKN